MPPFRAEIKDLVQDIFLVTQNPKATSSKQFDWHIVNDKGIVRAAD